MLAVVLLGLFLHDPLESGLLVLLPAHHDAHLPRTFRLKLDVELLRIGGLELVVRRRECRAQVEIEFELQRPSLASRSLAARNTQPTATIAPRKEK